MPPFIAHRPGKSGSTLFRDNRTGRISTDPLTFWEKKVDDHGRSYYLDHVAKSASYCNPLKQAAYDRRKEAGTPMDEPYFVEWTVDGRKFWALPKTGGALPPWERENRESKM